MLKQIFIFSDNLFRVSVSDPLCSSATAIARRATAGCGLSGKNPAEQRHSFKFQRLDHQTRGETSEAPLWVWWIFMFSPIHFFNSNVIDPSTTFQKSKSSHFLGKQLSLSNSIRFYRKQILLILETTSLRLWLRRGTAKNTKFTKIQFPYI